MAPISLWDDQLANRGALWRPVFNRSESLTVRVELRWGQGAEVAELELVPALPALRHVVDPVRVRHAPRDKAGDFLAKGVVETGFA